MEQGSATLSHPPLGARLGDGLGRAGLLDRLHAVLASWRLSLERELVERAGFQWLAVAFSSGCFVYFVLPREPGLLLLLVAGIAAATPATLLYLRGLPWRALALLTACLAGMITAKARVDRLDGPQIERSISAEISGRVLDRDQRAGRRPRVVLDRVSSATKAGQDLPARIRLTISPSQELPPLGARVTMKARLTPVSGPAVPGGYDPRRAAFFDGIGGSGFVLGRWHLVEGPDPNAAAFLIARIRAGIVARILAVEPGEAGAVAAALLVGERSALSERTNESLRVSGLAHILSISGLHMMLIAGTAYFVVRALLALSPRLALAYPIRKWAAMAALLVVTLYFALSGGGAATIRAYVMAAIMFSAILLDRPAISMRNLAVAAMVVLLLEPESVAEPGFQMSFAAVAALIASWEAWRGRRRLHFADEDSTRFARLLRAAGAAFFAVILTSLVAGLATAPFSAYHFERIATYSLLGNLLAAPLVSALIMPFGLLTLVLLPVGLEAFPLRVMAWGIDLLLWISDWVAGLPGADISAPKMSSVSLLLIAFGMLWLCLWRLRWRLLGVPAIGLGLALIPVLADPADLLIAADGKAVAVRDSAGLLRISGSRPGAYIVAQFLAEEPGSHRDPSGTHTNTPCDPTACLLFGRGGLVVSHVLEQAAFAEDCRRADILVTALLAPADCHSRLIVDRRRLERYGAHAVRIVETRPKLVLTLATERSATPRPWQATGTEEKSEANISASAP